jgi:protein TonB
MFSNPLIRLIVGVPAAIAVTLALFFMMNFFISVKEVSLEEKERITLSKITPQIETADIRANSRSQPKKIDSANKPPPPPKLSAAKSDVNLPTPTIQGAAPTEVKFERLEKLAFDPVAVSDRDAQPIRPPVPSFPQRALERGIEGECEVKFDVDVRGKPYNVVATCTDSIFVSEAKRAVEKVEFAPKIERGKPAERRNVVYPLVFQIAQ